MMPGYWLPLRENNLRRHPLASSRSKTIPLPLQFDHNQFKIPPANNSPDAIGLCPMLSGELC